MIHTILTTASIVIVTTDPLNQRRLLKSTQLESAVLVRSRRLPLPVVQKQRPLAKPLLRRNARKVCRYRVLT